MIKEISRVKLQFKNTSDPSDIIELQSSKEFFTEGKADEFLKKILEICSPIHEAKRYKVEVWYDTEETLTAKPNQKA